MNELLTAIDQVADRGPFQPNWTSLKTYQIPQWYEDAKFGVFIHWGVYSVPGFSSEWYPREMYRQGTKEFQHHIETYGPHDQFGYKDFIPMMKYENYDPEEYASLFQEAGVKFVMPVAEHHDGFAMYDTALSRWSAAKMGPKRDVLGDLADAVRKRGMVFSASSHRAEHFWFFNGGRDFPSDVQAPEFADLYGPAMPVGDTNDPTQGTPTKEHLEDWLIRTCELVDKYRPQIVWFDWWIQQEAFAPYLQKFAAYYYNRGAEWGLGVAINYKYAAYPEGSAVFDVERGQLAGIRERFWQTDTSVSKNSWGYIANHDYKSVDSLVDDLVDIVSKNGALLLNIGPKPDGTIPEPEQEMLRQIGAWLKVNGEAIYGTRPWTIFGEGPTDVKEGAFTDTERQEFTGEDLRFTTKGDTLYAIALAWPGAHLAIKSLGLGSGRAAGSPARITLLGDDRSLSFTQTEEALIVELPAAKSGEYAYTLKIDGFDLSAGKKKMESAA
ncbi:alpha-L-fucosidase [Capsulimonas corticalis]|uniref:alpha-L-fucosidase n=1 Tax=Capsulimonas corticalis TaxID=2219043 RepID=A0A402CQF3_9BACT|nr:alpha-L-fucosidase [Capsulimonas corticalis]BDI34366.1 alpha-L-fucosidase [Capsulimonas corticalis]